MIAKSRNITYKGISTPQEFWDYLATFPKNSISRVYYSGHASADGLFLSLAHDSACTAVANRKDIVFVNNISNHSALKEKFAASTPTPSKFYGCYTSAFANEWRKVFGVPAEGALHKIDFGSVNRPSNIPNVLERLQQNGNPDWKSYR
jgi:hypothetical protein